MLLGVAYGLEPVLIVFALAADSEIPSLSQ